MRRARGVAPASRLALLLIGLSAVWAGGSLVLFRAQDAQHTERLAEAVRGVDAALADTEAALRREAVLLASEPAVMLGAARGDWATLVRGTSPRIVTLTVDGLADIVLVLDGAGAPLVRVPAAPQVSTAALGPAAGRASGVRMIEGRAYVAAFAPVRDPGGASVGTVMLASALERLAPRLAALRGDVALVVLAGDRAVSSTFKAVPVEGWERARRGGPMTIDGEPWRLILRNEAVADGVWAAVSDRRWADDRRRLWRSVAGSWILAVAGCVGAAMLLGRWRTVAGAEHRRDDLEMLYAAAVTTAQDKSRTLETLTRLTQTLTATLALDDVVQKVVDSAVELFEGTTGRLWLVDEDGDHLSLRSSAGATSSVTGVTRLRVGEGLTGVIAVRRELLIVSDVRSDPRTRNVERSRAEGLVSFAGVPLLLGDRLVGVLAIAARGPRAYTGEDTALLQSLASQAAIAIHNATLFSEERTRHAYLTALLEINTKIGSMAPTDAVLGSIAEEAARLLDVDNAGFRLLLGDDLVVAGVAGAARETMARPRLKIGESLSGRVVREGRTIIVDLDRAPELVPEHLAADRRLGYASFLGVPLHVGDRAIGVLTFRARRAFTRRDAELAEAFAGQAAVAIEHSRLYGDARLQAKRMAALADLGRLLSETLDPDKVGQRVTDSICTLLGARSSALYRLDRDTGGLAALTVSGEAPGSFHWARELPADDGLAWLAVRQRRPVATPDVLTDGRVVYTPEMRERIDRATARAVLAVPLLVQDRLLGVLAVADGTGRLFDDEEIRLAQAFADQAAIALENARLFHDEDRRRQEAEALARVARTLAESLDVSAVGERVVDSVLTLFDVQSAGLRLVRPDGSLVGLAQAGASRVHFEPGTVVPRGIGLVGRAVAEGRPLWSPDVLAEPEVVMTDDLRRRIVESGDRAFLAFPLRAKGAVIGVLSVADGPGRVFTDAEIKLLEVFAHQAAIALENARLYAETTRRLEESRALLQVAGILNSTLESTQLLKRVAVTIAHVCGVDRCSLELWDGGQVTPLMSQFADGRRADHLWKSFKAMRPYAPGEVPAHATAIATRRPIVIDDTAATDQIPREWIDVYGLKSCMVVPLIRQDQVIGVMTLDYCERATPFTEWQVELAVAIAGQVALSVENARLYAQVQERLRETTTLLAVTQVLSQPGPGSHAMRLVAREAARAFGADMVGAYALDARDNVLVPVAGYRVPPDLRDVFVQRPVRLSRSPLLVEAWRSGRSRWTADAGSDPGLDAESVAALPPHSLLFAPTMVRGEPVGGLFLVWWRVGRVPSAAETRLLDGVAAQVGLAMENRELSLRTQEKLRETETLLSVSRALSTTLDLEMLMRHLLRRVAGAVQADSVGLWLLDASGEWMEPRAGYHVPPDRLEAIRAVRLSTVKHEFYREAARTRRPVFSTDAMADSRLPEELKQVAAHSAHLFVPIVAQERLLGGFAAVWWDRGRDFSEGELALMEAIASQAGVAIENARLFAENRDRVEELSVLNELSRAVTGQLDQAALLESIRSQVPRVLASENLTVVLHDETRDELAVALRVRDGVTDGNPPRRYPARAVGLMSIVLATGGRLRTDDYAEECQRRGVEPVAGVMALPYWLGVPLVTGDHVLGVLNVSRGDRAFSDADERLLASIADVATLALRSARLFEERTRAYGELAAAQDQLVRTEKLRVLGEMASGVAHDFNNLLASILGRAQLLLTRVQEPTQRQWLQVIERSALDGAQTVKRLQDFTRIRRDAPLVAVDLNQVVRDGLDITQARWREDAVRKGGPVEVRTRLAAALPPVAGDPAELREVMTNLILNAVDAMPGGGTLTLATSVVEGAVVVAVADTGVGIPEAVRPKIFDPFFTTKGPQGTGLGLSMTYGILSRHGARIDVDSEEGRGTTFRLTFPVSQTERPVEPATAPAAPPAGPVLRCLVVDDEDAVADVIADVLVSGGHESIVINDGVQAIERVRTERFDVVFTDLAMPGVSGWQVARAVKEAAPGVPVFLVTGFGVELSAEERRTHGVAGVLVKPLKIQDLLDAAAHAARRRAGANPRED